MNKITDILKNNMMEYATYTIHDRALPSVEDAMKPIHRKIMWTMYEAKITKLTKSANVTGLVMKYSPHGDCYKTVVNMVQSDRQNHPLIIGKGNFGQKTSKDLQPAASRYSEIKLSDIALDMMKGLNKKMVNFVPNYDNTRTQPEYLPVKFPAVLCYSSSGMAVGMSSSIPSFNLKEVCDATINYLTEGKKEYLVPDFATGGYIVKNDEVIENINENGKGTITLLSKYHIEKNVIVITEIPYSTTREAIIDKIVENVKNNKLKEVSNIKDLTGLEGMRIEITCKRGVNPEDVIPKLYALTPMKSTYSADMNVLSEGHPMVLGVYEMIDKWTTFRKKCIKNALTYEIQEKEKELILLYGLKKILLDVDKAIHIIRFSDVTELKKVFDLTDEQAEYVYNLRLKSISEDNIHKQIKDIDEKEKMLEKLKKIVKNDKAIVKMIIKDLTEISKTFGKPRKTQVIEYENNYVETKAVKKEKIIDDYACRIIFTEQGYLKKVKLVGCKGENKIKPDDVIIQDFECRNSDEIVLFAEDKNCYKFKVSDLSECKFGEFGTYMPGVLKVKTLNLCYITPKTKYVVIVYKDRIAKIDIDVYRTTTNRRKLANSLFDTEINHICTLENDIKITLQTNKKDYELDTSKLICKKSRNTQGVKVLNNNTFIKVRL